MEEIPFRLIGGNPMLPGMLCWVNPPKGAKRPKPPVDMARIVAIAPEKDETPSQMSITVAYADGREETVTGDRVEMLYYSTPPYSFPPEFVSGIAQKSGVVTFWVGHQIYFPEEATVRQLTGHVAMECLGYIARIDPDHLIVGFSAVQANETTKRFVLRVLLSEIVIVGERITIGTMLVTMGVEGSRNFNIYNPRWQKLSQPSSDDIKSEEA